MIGIQKLRWIIITGVFVSAAAEAQTASSPAASGDGTPVAPSAPMGEPATPAANRAPSDKQPGEPVAEPAGFTWQPFGYLRMQYIAVQNDPNVAFIGRDDGFELQNARLGVRGQLGLRASFLVAFDGAVDERAQINSPQGKLKVGLRDAYTDVAVSGRIAVRGGLFQTWVDPEALVADTAREFVDRPIESRGIRATEGWQTPGLPPGRSLGAALRLDPIALTPPDGSDGPRVGFELAVQNGADEYSSNNDNDKPAASAALVVRFHDSWIVGAARWNPRTVGDLPFRQDETDVQGTLGAHLAAGPLSLGAGVIVQHTTFESTGGPSQNAFGGHAQVMFRVPGPHPFAFGYRFGIIDPSSLIVTDRVMEHTAAALVSVPSLRMRVQLQLTHVIEDAARDLSNDRVQLAAEVSL
ncbi:MAG: hypothetical protein JWO36_1521 [Myxococcales bacterium]|nr:hypothetical protein [Myxococcales bacterium]